MRYQVSIRGLAPLIMHNGAAGLDSRSPANVEKAIIAKKRGSNRTEADDLRIRELECQTSFWLDSSGTPTIPAGAIRACIEQAARKLKQGPQVREGLLIESIDEFQYNKELGTTSEELSQTVQFTVGVVVQRARILRTRAKFDEWGAVFTLEVDEELVDLEQLQIWLDIAGRRIGLGDWRPTCSGDYGRFETVSVKSL